MSNPDCGRGTITREHPDKPLTYQFLNTSCKKLTCPKCGPWKVKSYRKAILAAAKEHGLQRHVTLTLDPGLIPKEVNSIDYIQAVWARFRTFLKDHRDLQLTYIRVVELQRSGAAHYHLLIRETVAQDTLLSAWVACGGGHQVRIRFRDAQRGAAYVTKYITKDLLLEIPPGRRRVCTCQGIRLFPPPVPSGWTWNPYPIWLHFSFAHGEMTASVSMPITPDYFESESPPLDFIPGQFERRI